MTEKRCILTKEQCNELESLRLNLWDKTFSIQKSSKDIKDDIIKIEKMISGTEQNISHIEDLKNMKNTADFLTDEHGSVTELYRYHDKVHEKPYRQFGYFNNIISEIDINCGCKKHRR